MSTENTIDTEGKIAIIGMSGRFPGASTIFSFWDNLIKNKEGVSHYTEDEIKTKFNIEISNDFIKSFGFLENENLFDANFFKFTDNESTITSPQQRLFIECAYEALEQAGIITETYQGLIGVYAGSSETDYLRTLQENATTRSKTTPWQLKLANGIDFLSSRTSYKLGLKGPAVSIQTACSTSLVAVHLACNDLLLGDSDIALAGGSTVHANPIFSEHMEGGVLSPDGKCRAFDDNANGTVASNGVGIVVLKRLQDAIDDKDNIISIIKGTSVNNDGNSKIGFTAPSIQGQVAVFENALEIANTKPEDVEYIEAHGTATELGDPIEVTALNRVYNSAYAKKCWLGSVKSNIGHTDSAAGVCGLIKTSLAVNKGIIPASLHFNTLNSKIDFSNSRLQVAAKNQQWKSNKRTAAISSLGIGGTNAHVIIENFNAKKQALHSNKEFLFPISAKSIKSLKQLLSDYKNFNYENIQLEEIAWTLQTGRKTFNYKTHITASSLGEFLGKLHSNPHLIDNSKTSNSNPIVFLFPGQGGQYSCIGKQLYDNESIFKNYLDTCFNLFENFDISLKAVLFSENDSKINDMVYAQASIFSIEYALAKYYQIVLDTTPKFVLGHSLGAYAAAVIAGVFSLETAIKIIIKRSEILNKIDDGTMIAVLGTVDNNLEKDNISVAVKNSSQQTVLSGSKKHIQAYADKLDMKKSDYRWLHINSAAHSHLLDPYLNEFSDYIHTLEFYPPKTLMISDSLGRILTESEATSPNYWTNHLRNTIEFEKCCDYLLERGDYNFIELGTGQTLSTLISQNSKYKNSNLTGSIPHVKDEIGEYKSILKSFGELWNYGVAINWKSFYDKGQPWRIALPGYAFDRKDYSIKNTKLVDALEPVVLDIKTENNFPKHNDVLEKLTTLFSKILGKEHINSDSNFFKNGGDSLMALKLFKEIKSNFKVKLSVREIFKTPTPSDLSKKIITHSIKTCEDHS